MAVSQRLSNEDLKQLLPRCLNRDETAWEEVFHGLYGLVKSVVLKIHLNDDDVDDAIADAFTCIVNAIDEVAEASNPLGYIGAVARHAALSSRKRIAARAHRETSLDASSGSDGAAPSGASIEPADSPRQELSAMGNQIVKELARLRNSLSPEEGRLLRLKYADDLTYEEIAYISGRESGALRVAIHRLIARLRDQLDPDVREAVLADPRLLARLGDFTGTGPGSGDEEPLDEKTIRLLEDYVATGENLDSAATAEIEARLAASSALREKKVRLERLAGETEMDVVGHAPPEPMPSDMLNRLMGVVKSRNPDSGT